MTVEECKARRAAGSDSSTAAGKPFFKRGMTVEQCENMIQRSFTNPSVKLLKEHLVKSGCSISSNFIKAVHCNTPVAGCYRRGKGIEICANFCTYQDEVTQLVIHELIHAYDDCRVANMDWTNCAHQACMEIRAGHLSGDCHFKRELLRGFFKLKGQEQVCIRRRVMLSMAHNPFCTKAASKEAMEAVWDTCYNDTKPFDKAP